MATTPFTGKQLIRHLQALQDRWPTDYWVQVTAAELVFLMKREEEKQGSTRVMDLDIPLETEQEWRDRYRR